jgi:uncharacterized phiE125 gp8 family phage protein
MSSILLTPPAVEPLSLAEAKDYLRVEHADDDDVIAALIASARAHVEAATRRALITQTWRHSRDAWPRDGRIAVLPAPLKALVGARVYDQDGTPQEIDLESFVVDTVSAPGVVAFPPWSVPSPGRAVAGVELDVTVGYGDAAADVPAPLALATRLLLAHWYEYRGVVAPNGATATLPMGVAELIAPYRVLSL